MPSNPFSAGTAYGLSPVTLVVAVPALGDGIDPSVICSGAGLQASEPQLYRSIVSAHSTTMRLPDISIFES
jgi:hypothetical protein